MSYPPLYRKVAWRIIPILFSCYLLNYLDRINVSFATLTMSQELGMDPAAYGFGAGLFFVGYFFFEVPSNLLLYRFGARIWIARIVFSWGLCSMATAFVRTELQFFIARFLLGACEAGFFPGVILYLTWWFPVELRARATSGFFAAVTVAGIIGGPISGWILDHFEHVGNMESWQWLFLLEGLPCLFTGFWVLAALPDRPRDAKWLTPSECEQLEKNIAAESEASRESGAASHTWSVFRTPGLWILSLLYFAGAMGLYGVAFWLPSIVRSAGWKDPFIIGILTAVPWTAALIAMLLVGRSSDQTRERRWHGAVPAAIAGLAFCICGLPIAPWLHLAALSFATAGAVCYVVMLLTLPGRYMIGPAAAAGIATINSIGNLGGFISPTAVGWLTKATGSASVGGYFSAAFLFTGCAVLLAWRSLRS